MLDAALEAEALDWAEHDPDAATAAQLRALVDAARAGDEAALAELQDSFAGPLEFGTAGLRAALGPGPARMNRVVVQRAAAGLGRWLNEHGHAGSRVLVGYDARHNSDVFARDTAEVLAGLGLQPILTDTQVPTPLVPFGIGRLGCAAGVVVTASHNPPADNGYKVYVGGSQIVPPTDAQIAAEIRAASTRPVADLPHADTFRTIGNELVDAYVERAASLIDADAPRAVTWAYTPLHGVGLATMTRVVEAAGFPAAHVVAEQAEPDPDFPTVAFPNPEEPGAIDLCLALAARVDADVAIANDPDADRCAVAARFGGDWRMLTGDELGALLAWDALESGRPGTYACSIVSSSLLGRMAAAAGQPFATTLTGFKWIGRVPGLAFGYEEAIGYCTDPEWVQDKDGLTALVRVLALTARLKAQGRTITDALDAIMATHGVHLNSQLSFRVSDLSIIADAMARLRAALPSELAGEAVEASDLRSGWHGLPPTDAVLLAGDNVRVVVRPSGTEPKLKCYCQVRRPAGEELDASRAEAAAVMGLLRHDIAAALGL